MIDVVKIEGSADYDEALAIRRRVFVDEQGVPAELEVDAYEQESTFFLARLNGKALGTGRFRTKGPLLKFERIATLAEARGKGVGSALMASMEAHGAAAFPRYLPYMHAQASALEFYEKIGWERAGALFHEAGIAHYVMIKPPAERSAIQALLYLADPGALPDVLALLRRRLGGA